MAIYLATFVGIVLFCILFYYLISQSQKPVLDNELLVQDEDGDVLHFKPVLIKTNQGDAIVYTQNTEEFTNKSHCFLCDKEIIPPIRCSFCDNLFCTDHSAPHQHSCPGLPETQKKKR